MRRNVEYFSPREFRDVRSWNQAADEMLQPTAITPSGSGPFELRAEGITLGSVRLVSIDSGRYQNERSPAFVGRATDPRFTVTLQRAGRSRIEQDGEVTELGPGDFAITDSSRAYRREYLEYSRVLVVLFPQQMLSLPPRALSGIVGKRIAGDEGLGAIVSSFLEGVAENLAALQEPLGLAVVDGMIDLVTSLVASGLTEDVEAGSAAWQLLEIREFIMENLADPTLTPASIARANFVSLRQVHALFARSGTTVAAWIRDRRLEMCRRDLADPLLRTRSVREISESWGFANQTYFAKVFRATFGYSPTTARRGAQ